jgi:hypothetical protein
MDEKDVPFNNCFQRIRLIHRTETLRLDKLTPSATLSNSKLKMSSKENKTQSLKRISRVAKNKTPKQMNYRQWFEENMNDEITENNKAKNCENSRLYRVLLKVVEIF